MKYLWLAGSSSHAWETLGTSYKGEAQCTAVFISRITSTLLPLSEEGTCKPGNALYKFRVQIQSHLLPFLSCLAVKTSVSPRDLPFAWMIFYHSGKWGHGQTSFPWMTCLCKAVFHFVLFFWDWIKIIDACLPIFPCRKIVHTILGNVPWPLSWEDLSGKSDSIPQLVPSGYWAPIM